jgi:hypothetical protein
VLAIQETEDILNSVQIDTLILDCVFLERTHATHISLPEALDYVRRFKPRRAYFVGMTHEVHFALRYSDTLKIYFSLIQLQLAYLAQYIQRSFL